MRRFAAYLIFGILSACRVPQGTEDTSRASTPEPSSSSASQPLLIFNADPKVPILTAFGKGILKIEDGCLVFEAGNTRFTPVWPHGTQWSGTGAEIVTPAGGHYALGAAVVLSGGPMGSVSGSDLKPDTVPGKLCPPNFFGVHPN